VGAWRENLAGLVQQNPDEYLRAFTSGTDFTSAINRWTPDLLDEVHGLGEASGIDYATMFAFQLLDEEWWYREAFLRTRQEGQAGCTSLGWAGEGDYPAILAQNMDLSSTLDGYQVVLHIVDEQAGIEALVFSIAGLIALNGVNNAGVGIVCNNLGQLNHAKNGLPVAFVLRGALQQKDFSAARNFLQSVRHASGQNYILGGRDQVLDLECSANQVKEYTFAGVGGKTCHSNHPLSNADLRKDPMPGRNASGVVGEPNEHDLDSQKRFERAACALRQSAQQPLSPGMMAYILSSHEEADHPICRHPGPGNNWMTVGTSVMILDREPSLLVCPGPPCSSKFSRFTFTGQ
jgi:hypothetical protein